jgi:hypothetical protein
MVEPPSNDVDQVAEAGPHRASPADRKNEETPRTAGLLANISGSSLVTFLSQVGVVTAILFYFGWARARATYGYFGVDVSVLDFSVSDYVLRSVSTVFPLIATIGFLVIGALIAHERLRPVLGRESTAIAGTLVAALEAAGTVLVAVGFVLSLAVDASGGPAIAGPLTMLVGFAVGLYALISREIVFGRRRSRLVPIVIGMLLITFLWTITSYADYVGVQTAKQVQNSLAQAPNIVIYSAASLALSGPGITLSSISERGGEYHFRYTGLRLLIASGGQYFLLPSGWRPGDGSVIVLPTLSGGGTGSTRIEFQEQ